MRIYCLAAGLAAAVFACPVVASENKIVGTITRVVDGDTIIIGKAMKVRLWGCSAPDRPAWKKERSKLVLAFFAESKVASCVVRDHNPATERFTRRDVAQCRVREVDLCEFMVRTGYAKDDKAFSGGHYAQAERDARQYERGLWGSNGQSGENISRNDGGGVPKAPRRPSARR